MKYIVWQCPDVWVEIPIERGEILSGKSHVWNTSRLSLQQKKPQEVFLKTFSQTGRRLMGRLRFVQMILGGGTLLVKSVEKRAGANTKREQNLFSWSRALIAQRSWTPIESVVNECWGTILPASFCRQFHLAWSEWHQFWGNFLLESWYVLSFWKYRFQ